MEPRRTGSDNYAVKSVFADVLFDLGLSRFGTGVTLIGGENDAGKFTGISRNGGAIHRLADIGTAMADVHADADSIMGF